MFKAIKSFMKRWRCHRYGHIQPVCLGRRLDALCDKAIYRCYYCDENYEVDLPFSRRTIFTSRLDKPHS